MRKVLFSLLLVFHLLQTAAQSESEQLESNTRELYSSLGVDDGLPYDHFRSGYLRYLRGKQGQEPEFKKSVITFVNFGLSSNQKRLYLVDVSRGSAKLLLHDYTTHGRNSDPDHDGMATIFSNDDGSKQSSLGYFKIDNFYKSDRVGDAIKLHGLSGDEYNSLAFDPRGVVIHMGPYVERLYIARHGKPGRSSGCFVLPSDVWESYLSNVRDGSLLYAFEPGNVFDPGSDEGLLGISNSDTSSTGSQISRGSPAQTFGDHPTFNDAPPTTGGLDNSGTSVTPETGIDGDSALAYDGEGAETEEEDEIEINDDGSAPHAATANHRTCQKLLNSDVTWNQAAIRSQNGEDPHSFFRGSWVELGEVTSSTDDATYSAATAAGQNHLGVVRECAGLLIIHDTQNPTTPETLKSADGTQVCQIKSLEDQTYSPCKELIRNYDETQEAVNQQREEQAEAFAAKGSTGVETLKEESNVQDNAVMLAADLSKTAMNNSQSRTSLQTARLDTLANGLAAIPTYKSTLQKCRQRYAPYADGGVKEYKAWTKIMVRDQVPTTLPTLKDPCAGVVHRLGIKHIQNKKLKDSMKGFLNELGYKIEDLEDKSSALGTQTGQLLNNRLGGTNSVSNGKHEYNTFRPDAPDSVGDHINITSSKTKSGRGPRANIGSRKIGSVGPRGGGKADKLLFNQLYGKMNKNSLPTTRNLRFKAQSQFIKLLKSGRTGNLLAFMVQNGLELSDLDKALSAGLISKVRHSQLSNALSGRIGKNRKVRTFGVSRAIGSVKSTNREWQVEKDKSKNIFDIISHRYFKQSFLFSH